MKGRIFGRVSAGALLIAASLLAMSAWSGMPWHKAIVPASDAIKAIQGAAFEVRLPNRSRFAKVFENGVRLGPRTYGKADVKEEGRGVFFLKGDTIRFSTSDNTDPRTNGRTYRIEYSWRYAGAVAIGLCCAALALSACLMVRGGSLRKAMVGVRQWTAMRRGRIRDRFRDFGASPLSAMGRFVIRNGWLVVLAIPSLMLLAWVPPLWRDSDGVWQIAERPGVFTILHWPPLYTFGARIPLWIGAWVDSAFFGGMPPGADYFARPHFSNSAIYALITAQHLLLFGALSAMTAVLSKRLLFRYGVAVFFSLNAYLYLFAQTVGSESLSNALTIAFLAAAIVVYRQATFHFPTWLICGALLVLCLLTRHINAVLAGLLPLAFLLEGIMVAFPGGRIAPLGFFPRTHPWGQFSRALAVGIVAIALSGGILRVICMANGIEYRSRMGYTFQFRLNFLASLSTADRHDLLLAVGDRVPDAPLKEIVRSLDRGAVLDANSEENFIHERLMSNAGQAGIRTRAARLADTDRKLTVLARAFLLPPSRIMATVILSDFWRGWRWTPTDIAETPIHTTNYLIWSLNQDRYKPVAGLRGLQQTLTRKNLSPVLMAYIDLWKWCPFWVFSTAALLACAVLLVREHLAGADSRPSALCLSLVLIGTGLMLLNCSMTFNLPRFWMPFVFLMEVSVLCAALGAAGRRKSVAIT